MDDPKFLDLIKTKKNRSRIEERVSFLKE